jgi:hypothetical protein
VDTPGDIYRAVSTPLARLLEIPYVRFVEPARRSAFYDSVEMAVESYVPARALGRELGLDCDHDPRAHRPYQVSLHTKRLDRREALDVCTALAADTSLRSGRALRPRMHPPAQDADFGEVEEDVGGDCEAPEPTRHELTLYPSREGTYLVEVTTSLQGRADESDVIARDFSCIDVNEPQGYVSVQIGYKWGFGASDATYESTDGLRVLAAWSAPATEDGLFLTGITVGYSFAHHEGLTPPSWNDALASPVGFDGTTVYTWDRHALLLGPQFTLEGNPWCRPFAPCGTGPRRFNFVAQVSPMFDAGFISPNDAAKQFTAFVTTRGGPIFDPRITFLLQAGISRRVNASLDLAVLADIEESGGLLDFRRLVDWSDHQIGYAGEWTAGLTLEARWGL